MAIKIILLIIFFGLMLGVGLYCRRHATDVTGFVLGGRSVGPWLTAFAYGTSYFSAVIFVGYAGQFGFRYGIASTWIGLANAFLGSLLAWALLGRRTRVMTQHLKTSTMSEFFEKRFNSPSLKIAAALIIFLFLIPYTASLYNGLSRLFSMAFSVDYSFCILAMAVLTCIYVVAGGYMATAINDFIQGIIMLVGIVAVVVAVLNVNGGFSGSMEALSMVSDPSVSSMQGAFTSFFGPDPFDLFCVVILTSLGTWGLPQMVQKFYAIRSERDISKGMVVSTVFALIVAGGCYFLGGFGRLFSTPESVAANGYDSIIPEMMARMPDLLIAVIVILVLSASMSTLSSLVLTSSSTVTLDLIKKHIVRDLKEKTQLLLIRIFVGVFIVISAVIAILQYKYNFSFIAQLMGLSWGALAGAFLAPFLYGLYWKHTTKAAVWVSFAFGTTVMLLNMILKPYFPTWLQSSINCGAVAMLFGLILVPVVSLFTKKPEETHIAKVFDCYNSTVEVPVHRDLGEKK